MINRFIEKCIDQAGKNESLTPIQKDDLRDFLKSVIKKVSVDVEISRELSQHLLKINGADYNSCNFLTFKGAESLKDALKKQLGHEIWNHCSHDYDLNYHSIKNTKTILVI